MLAAQSTTAVAAIPSLRQLCWHAPWAWTGLRALRDAGKLDSLELFGDELENPYSYPDELGGPSCSTLEGFCSLEHLHLRSDNSYLTSTRDLLATMPCLSSAELWLGEISPDEVGPLLQHLTSLQLNRPVPVETLLALLPTLPSLQQLSCSINMDMDTWGAANEQVARARQQWTVLQQLDRELQRVPASGCRVDVDMAVDGFNVLPDWHDDDNDDEDPDNDGYFDDDDVWHGFRDEDERRQVHAQQQAAHAAAAAARVPVPLLRVGQEKLLLHFKEHDRWWDDDRSAASKALTELCCKRFAHTCHLILCGVAFDNVGGAFEWLRQLANGARKVIEIKHCSGIDEKDVQELAVQLAIMRGSVDGAAVYIKQCMNVSEKRMQAMQVGSRSAGRKGVQVVVEEDFSEEAWEEYY